jgi:YggT family protein
MENILHILSLSIFVYSGVLLLRILLSWFPSINWYSQPFVALTQVTDPYLNIFRRIIPPMGGLDFSAMLALIVLNLLQRALASAF